MILASASISNPDFTPQPYQTYLLTVCLMVVHATLASLPTKWIARNNSVGSTFNIIALIVVVIIIPAACDRTAYALDKFNASSDVWGTIYPGTEFPPGVSVLMSFSAVIWTMSGYDAPFHLSEECSNANVAAPRAIVLTSATGGVFGWFLNLVVAYTVVDIPSIIDSDLGQPFAAYVVQVLPQPVALAVLSLTIIAGFAMGQGCMIAASRVTFAYSRDGCFPLSRYWSMVNPYTRTPVNAVWFNTLIGCLLLLMIFGGTVTIDALFSIGALASFFAFTTPIMIRVFFVGNRFRPGPWNLGMFSLPVGALATAFVLLMVPILCLPAYVGSDLTPDLMNWTCLVWGGPMFIALVWFAVDARKWFKGPRVNLEHLMHGRDEQAAQLAGGQIEGKDVDGGSDSDRVNETVSEKHIDGLKA